MIAGWLGFAVVTGAVGVKVIVVVDLGDGACVVGPTRTEGEGVGVVTTDPGFTITLGATYGPHAYVMRNLSTPALPGGTGSTNVHIASEICPCRFASS